MIAFRAAVITVAILLTGGCGSGSDSGSVSSSVTLQQPELPPPPKDFTEVSWEFTHYENSELSFIQPSVLNTNYKLDFDPDDGWMVEGVADCANFSAPFDADLQGETLSFANLEVPGYSEAICPEHRTPFYDNHYSEQYADWSVHFSYAWGLRDARGYTFDPNKKVLEVLDSDGDKLVFRETLPKCATPVPVVDNSVHGYQGAYRVVFSGDTEQQLTELLTELTSEYKDVVQIKDELDFIDDPFVIRSSERTYQYLRCHPHVKRLELANLHPQPEDTVVYIGTGKKQCTEPTRTLAEVSAYLTDVEVAVEEAQCGYLVSTHSVCQACGCASSDVYLLTISEEDLATAENIGFRNTEDLHSLGSLGYEIHECR